MITLREMLSILDSNPESKEPPNEFLEVFKIKNSNQEVKRIAWKLFKERRYYPHITEVLEIYQREVDEARGHL